MIYSGDEYYSDEITSPLVRPQAPIVNRHIASYLNRAGDIEVIVTLLASGNYAVRIYDVDAAETLPFARHYKTEDAARAYALKCAAANDYNEDLPL